MRPYESSGYYSQQDQAQYPQTREELETEFGLGEYDNSSAYRDRPWDTNSVLADALGIRSPRGLGEDTFGVTAANATRAAQALQERLGRDALGLQDESQRRLEETLSPFVGFGTDLMPEYNGLFAGNAPDSFNQNITDLTSLADSALSGLSGFEGLTGGMGVNANIVGADLLSGERNDLLQALNLGQASAAQQAAGNLQTGGSQIDLLSQLGNVQAAGGIGQANARAQGAQNALGAASTFANAFGNR